MDKMLNNLLMLYNDITLNIDFENKNVISFYKGNKLISENLFFDDFCKRFCEVEGLDDSSINKLILFFNNLNPDKNIFNLTASFPKKQSNKTEKYEIKGVMTSKILYMTFSKADKKVIESYDSVTKAFTREIVIDKIKQEIENKIPFALLIIDVDNFKLFNDTYGHMFGDIILTETISSVKANLKENDYIGRIGGDEFLVVIHTPNNSFDEIYSFCSKIKNNIFTNNIKQAKITITIGCSIYPNDGDDYEILFKKADKALYRGKRKGRDCFIIYTEERCGSINDYSLDLNYSNIESIDKTATNSQIIIAVYEILSKNGSLKNNLLTAFSLIGNFFLIERIHFHLLKFGNDEYVDIEWVDSKSKQYQGLIKPKKENHDIWQNALDQTGMVKLNQVKKEYRDNPFEKILLDEKTKSILGFQLKYADKEIGLIRFDSCSHTKFWQPADVSALMVISKIIAITVNKYNETTSMEKYLFLDSLTGIYKFSKLRDEITQSLLTNNRYSLLYLNIINFTQVNKSFGTKYGDSILLALANSIKENCINDYYCRIADDHFLIVTLETDTKALVNKYEKINDLFIKNTSNKSNVILRSGIYTASLFEEFSDAVDKALSALNSVDSSNVLTYKFFNKTLEEKYELENMIKNHMYKAIENDEFLLYLQPKVEIQTKKLYGAEALTRWNFMNKILLYPNSFIPLFEKLGFINNLDYHMFEKVCKFLKSLKDSGKELICISVNVSRFQSNLMKYVSKIEEIRKKYDIDAKYLEIEITEGMYIDNIDKVAALVSKLHSLGYRVSMDDFGSGYSNLASLAQLDFDVIKLDRSLCEEQDDGREKPILTFIRQLTNSLNVKVLCEGVENQRVESLLISLGYKFGQGYLYDKPLPALDFINKYIKK